MPEEKLPGPNLQHRARYEPANVQGCMPRPDATHQCLQTFRLCFDRTTKLLVLSGLLLSKDLMECDFIPGNIHPFTLVCTGESDFLQRERKKENEKPN